MFLEIIIDLCSLLMTLWWTTHPSEKCMGTLKYFRERITRNKVQPVIKKDTDSFQDFFLSVGKALLPAWSFSCLFWNESHSINDKPTAHIPRPTQYRNEAIISTTFSESLMTSTSSKQTQAQDGVFNYGLSITGFAVLLMQISDQHCRRHDRRRRWRKATLKHELLNMCLSVSSHKGNAL